MADYQAITFDETPSLWRVPGTYTEIRPFYGRAGVLDYPTRVLLVGQKITGSPGLTSVPVRLTRPDDAAARWGNGSQLDVMWRAFFLANPFSECWAIAQADPAGGTAATKTVTFTGTPTAGGVYALNIAGRRVSFAVAASASVTTIAAALAAAVTADPRLQVSATAAAGVATLTAKHLGALGNDIDARQNPVAGDALPAGLTAVVATGVAGAGVADVAAVLTAIAATWFTDIAFGQADATSVSAIEAELAARYKASGRMDGHAYFGVRADMSTAASLGAVRNSPWCSRIPAKAAGSAPWEWAAALCARAGQYLGDDPARQLRSLTLPGIVAPAEADQYTPLEQNQLLSSGNSTWDVLLDGTVVLQRVVTTYQVSNLGAADTAWLDIMVPKTASRVRYDWNAYVTLNYPRHKLTDDDNPAAQGADNIVTPRQMHGAWAARCRRYERRGWIEDVTRTAQESLFQRDPANRNRMQARQRIRIIGNLLQLFGALEFEA